MMLAKIPKDKQLIIFDFYDTIIHCVYYHKNHLRTGIKELVEKLEERKKILTISSDAGIQEMRRDFGYASTFDFLNKFSKIYDIKNIRYDRQGNDAKKYKDLNFICNEHNTPISKAIFIGDNYEGVDEYSAKRFGMDYIIVPKENKIFSFVSLLLKDNI